MGIRGKLLVLLLLISVGPLTINAALNALYLHRFGLHLADVTRTLLTNSAHAYLLQVVAGYQQLRERDNQAVEAALQLEAKRWRNGLEPAEPEPNSAWQLLQDFRPDLSARQYTVLATGAGFVYPPEEPVGLSRGRLQNRLVGPYPSSFSTNSYGYWLSNELESGLKQPIFRFVPHSPTGSEASFPGRSDPRLLPWYQAARDKMALTRTLAVDPGTGRPALFLAIPLRGPDGGLVGVAALARPLGEVLQTMSLPTAWSGQAQAMLVLLEKVRGETPGRLRIVATSAGGTAGPGAREGAYLEPDDPAEAEPLLRMVASGQAATARIVLRGQDTHWIFGAGPEGEPLPVVVVSHAAIVDEAVAAERHVRSKTLQSLALFGALLAAVVGLVVALAFAGSRRVTRPLARLADAARRLTGGDFQARAEIRTGDELEELGRIFNGLGPKLLERERMAGSLALAAEIQRHLLPAAPPEVHGFDIAAGGISCDETGGDYYDFLNLTAAQSGRLGLVVGDVSGHGIGAALLMASARGVLRTHAVCHEGDMARLFRLLNRHLYRDTGDERFMTLFYGVLDPGESTLRWNSAGHGPVLLRRRSGQVEELPPTGLPLGILREADWPPLGPLLLEPGDALLIGTDGLWETRNPAGEILGIGHLREVFAGCAQESAGEMYAEIMHRVATFRDGGRQEDDITLTIVKVGAPAAANGSAL